MAKKVSNYIFSPNLKTIIDEIVFGYITIPSNNTNNIIVENIIDDYAECIQNNKKIVIRLGKVLNSYSLSNNIKPTSSEIEKWISSIKSYNKKVDIKIVKGKDIVKFYNGKNYFYKNRGTLSNSCMRYSKCSKYISNFHKNIPELSMAIIEENNLVLARVLIWEIDNKKYYDRIYYSFQWQEKSILDWLEKNGIINIKEANIKIQLNIKNNYYPYMDNMKYLDINNVLYNSKKDLDIYLELTGTNGKGFLFFKPKTIINTLEKAFFYIRNKNEESLGLLFDLNSEERNIISNEIKKFDINRKKYFLNENFLSMDDKIEIINNINKSYTINLKEVNIDIRRISTLKNLIITNLNYSFNKEDIFYLIENCNKKSYFMEDTEFVKYVKNNFNDSDIIRLLSILKRRKIDIISDTFPIINIRFIKNNIDLLIKEKLLYKAISIITYSDNREDNNFLEFIHNFSLIMEKKYMKKLEKLRFF